jgi:hypothetical protein
MILLIHVRILCLHGPAESQRQKFSLLGKRRLGMDQERKLACKMEKKVSI